MKKLINPKTKEIAFIDLYSNTITFSNSKTTHKITIKKDPNTHKITKITTSPNPIPTSTPKPTPIKNNKPKSNKTQNTNTSKTKSNKPINTTIIYSTPTPQITKYTSSPNNITPNTLLILPFIQTHFYNPQHEPIKNQLDMKYKHIKYLNQIPFT